MTKCIVLCADDYGQEVTISKGILALVALRRLSAVSCLVTIPHWGEHAAWLKPHHDQVSIGMHFNLTEGKPLSAAYRAAYGDCFYSLGRLLSKAFLRQLDKQVLVAECHAQLDQFVAELGQLPDFIDGHQHVHHFPIIRDALLEVYQARLRQHHTYIRVVNHRFHATELKKMIIYFSGATALKHLLDKQHIAHNDSFSGVYEFTRASQYPQYFRQFLNEIGHRGLIMCHPGLQSTSTQDVIANARYQEYQYFSSDTFLTDCKENDVKLVTKFEWKNI